MSSLYYCAIIKTFLNQRKLGASEGTINQEIQRYQQLESVAVNDIRRDVRKKLRRSSMRVSAPFIFYFFNLWIHLFF